MQVSSASTTGAVVQFTRAEVLALSNLLLHAQSLPLEVRGPADIFGGLSGTFERLREQMTG